MNCKKANEFLSQFIVCLGHDLEIVKAVASRNRVAGYEKECHFGCSPSYYRLSMDKNMSSFSVKLKLPSSKARLMCTFARAKIIGGCSFLACANTEIFNHEIGYIGHFVKICMHENFPLYSIRFGMY